MIKQTLYFGNPTYLRFKNKQLVIHSKTAVSERITTRPIEDIGMLVLDHGQITITHNCIRALQSNNAVIISCDDKRMPHSLMLPLEGHSLQSKRYRIQLAASTPLKKNLWQQTVVSKINNQAAVLRRLSRPAKRLDLLAKRVQSGDPKNVEAQAAVYYWSQYIDGFVRDRYGDPPNNLLNYGYAIMRAIVARALVSSGMLLTIGIRHHNQYNAFCLADDIMEPFRPFVDLLVHNMYKEEGMDSFLSTKSKQRLLSLCQLDGKFGRLTRPLMVGASITTASLYDCFEGKKRKIRYPLIK